MENRRNNIIRALRAEQNQNIGDGRNEYRKKAFNKHIRAMTNYNKPIITMNNVDQAYTNAKNNNGTSLFPIGAPITGRPYKTIEETMIYPIHHIKSIPMEVPMQEPIQIPMQEPMQIPMQVERKVPKAIRRKSVKRVQKEVLPKGQRHVSRRAPLREQYKPTGQKGKKDYKKDILIRLLELQAVEHGNGKDDRRKKAFQRHINAIMKFPYEIETIDDLRTIYRKAHLPTHGIAYKAIHTLIPPKQNITRRKQVAYQPSSFL